MSTFWLKYRGALIPLRREETIVGRSPYCSIVVDSTQASRQHCALRLSGREVTVTDLSSTNGTRVNGERLTEPRSLMSGDVIAIGHEVLTVVVADGQKERSGRVTETRASGDFEETSTDAAFAALDLITALVDTTTSPPEARAQAMGASIEALLQRLKLMGGHLADNDAKRMTWAVTQAASWFGGAKDAWRDDLVARIQGAKR
ncbi:MAG: FHA domain-containing protein [Polyangiaceae bacterium]|nr:FHA domain-containing protein [Polyangiaceae bacterium]